MGAFQWRGPRGAVVPQQQGQHQYPLGSHNSVVTSTIFVPWFLLFFFFTLGLCPDFWYHPLIRVKTREVLFIANVPTSGTIPCSNIVQTFGAKFFHRTSRLEATLAQRPEHPVTYPITVTLTNPVRVNATSRLQIKPGLGRTQFEVKVKDKVI